MGGQGGAGGCSAAADCDDQLDCTLDTCLAGVCKHQPASWNGPGACPAGQYCDAAVGCTAAPACATAAQCAQVWQADACKVNVACDAATATCRFDVLDKDPDGFAPAVCGGSDCNDAIPTVFPGAPEVCDGVDNGCNGGIDDGATCPGLLVCFEGACVCPPENSCGGVCVDMATDPANCGSCSHACAPAAICSAGVCVCNAPALSCNGVCTDPQTDPAHCGGCGQACALAHASSACIGGACKFLTCEASFSDCDGNPTNGCEVQLASDPKSCGTCGHDCLGGACNAGKCSPVVIASGQPKPWGIAVDATHVYWTNRVAAGSIRRAPIGGGAEEILAANQNDPDGLAINSTHVYWANYAGSTLLRLPKSGGFPQPLASGGGTDGVCVTDFILAWTAWDGQTVHGANADGTGILTLSASGNAYPHRIATDGTFVWWANWTGFNTGGTVRRARLDGTAVTTVATGQSAPLGVAVDATHVYWTNEGDGKLMRAPAYGTGSVTTMTTGQSKMSGIAVDATHVYFVATGSGHVRRMLKAAPMRTVETLAYSAGKPVYIALDDVSVYWTNTTGGTVVRLAK